MPPSDPSSPSSQDAAWQESLSACARAGRRVVSLDDSSALAVLKQWETSGTRIRPETWALAREWVTYRKFAWFDSMVNQMRGDSEDAAQPAASASQRALAAFQALCQSVVRLAIVVDDSAAESLLDPSTYLVQIAPVAPRPSAVLRLHHPAAEADMEAAAHELPFSLPPSLQTLWRLSNGIDLDESGRWGIVGVGPARADWLAVTQGDWRVCERTREIVAAWRAFQGMYAEIFAYEAEQGEEVAGPRLLVRRLAPILMTYGGDDWCLDVTSATADGEYSIAYWDHEERDLTQGWTYSSFGAWFAAQVEAATW